jgi:hypothetical protein
MQDVLDEYLAPHDTHDEVLPFCCTHNSSVMYDAQLAHHGDILSKLGLVCLCILQPCSGQSRVERGIATQRSTMPIIRCCRLGLPPVQDCRLGMLQLACMRYRHNCIWFAGPGA